MLMVDRAFIGFNNLGVVSLRPIHGGAMIEADCLAASLPKVGAIVTRDEVRDWAQALSGANLPIRGAPSARCEQSRVLSGAFEPGEVEQQGIKTCEFVSKSGSQGALTSSAIRAMHSGDHSTGVIGG